MYLIVKQVALIPDEAIEEEAEVTKNIKRHFDQVMRPQIQDLH